MAAWSGWEKQLLDALKAPNTGANRRFLDTWNSYEESDCANNPLNTTQPYPGATACNSAGVKSYPSKAAGTAATLETLTNGRYDAIVAALRSGDPYSVSDPSVVVLEIGVWGTPNFADLYYREMGGGGSSPLPQAATPVRNTSNERQVASAWTRLMRALAFDAPRELRRVSAATAQLRKGVR